MKIGQYVQQKEGFRAFIPYKFPPVDPIEMDTQTIALLNRATLSLGRLDGITQLLPDLDFFIFMYVRKEASLSSQIEGTRATMADAIKAENEIVKDLPPDVDDIQHYIKAMNFGLKGLVSLPLSLRLLREVHKVLLTGGRSDFPATPGEFRISQNWIGGGSPATARFVPPPVHEMREALSDLEKFLHDDNDLPPLIKAALIHAQFETIHPFLDGNGRTGRLLTTFYLCQQLILEKPVLYLSAYFKKNRDVYFDLLETYHDKGDILPWIKFFLNGIAEVSEEGIETSKKITSLREKDLERIMSLGRSSTIGTKLLKKLFTLPIVTVKKVEEFTGLSRPNANKLVDKFIKADILEQTDDSVEYGRTFAYKKYYNLFNK